MDWFEQMISGVRCVAVSLLAMGTVCLYGGEPSPSKTLEEAFQRAGFDPAAEKCGWFSVIADPHLSDPPREQKGNSRLSALHTTISELNGCVCKPKFLMILGDLTERGNPCFGATITDASGMIADFGFLRGNLSWLSPEIAWRVLPGNHDARGPKDTEFSDFARIFPEHPQWSAFDFAGLRCITLNGGHAGDLGARQEAWLTRELAALPAERNLLVLLHQPAGGYASEWRVSKTLRQAVDARKGQVTILAGHNHGHCVQSLQTPSGKMARQIQIESARVSGKATWWAICVRDGQVVATIKRLSSGGYRRYDASRSRPSKWRLPWEGVAGVKRIYHPGTPGFREISRKPAGGALCGYFYFYLRELDAELDATLVTSPRKRLYAMGRLLRPQKEAAKEPVFEISSDGTQWQPLLFQPYQTAADSFGGMVRVAELPSALWTVPKLRVRVRFSYTDGSFTGFALGE